MPERGLTFSPLPVYNARRITMNNVLKTLFSKLWKIIPRNLR